MHNIFKYYPAPGIAYDIAKMLFVKLNPTNVWQQKLSLVDSQADDINFVLSHANLLPDPRPELSLFVYIPNNKTYTFLSSVIAKLIAKNFRSFSISTLISYFCDEENAKKDLFSFYLGPQHDTKSDIDLDYVIRYNKTIPEKIKLLLLGFTIYPSKYFVCLNKILNEFYRYIKRTWASSLSSTDDLNQFLVRIYENNDITPPTKSDHLDMLRYSYSLSYTTPDFLYHNFLSDNPFFITTESTISRLLASTSMPSTDQFLSATHALSDRNRLNVLSHIMRNHYLSTDDLVKQLNISHATIKYHLTQLQNAKLISASRKNRIVYYTFNPAGFNHIKLTLDNMEKGEMPQ